MLGVPHWPHIPPVWMPVRKHMLLDAGTLAGAKNTLDPEPRGGRDAAGRDAPPSWGLCRTDIEPGEHGNAGSRVQLATVLQRHRRFGKIRDRQELVIRGQFRRCANVAAELRRQRCRGFVHAPSPPEDVCEDNARELLLDPLRIQPHQVMVRREDLGVCPECCHRGSPGPLLPEQSCRLRGAVPCGHSQFVTRTRTPVPSAAVAVSRRIGKPGRLVRKFLRTRRRPPVNESAAAHPLTLISRVYAELFSGTIA
jgi:hypothetical protein